MFISSHVYAGTIIGVLCRDRPVTAFAAGVVSHMAMDLTPHWGDDNLTLESPELLRVAYTDGLIGLASLAALTAADPPPRRAFLAAIAGATVLDADKPCEYFFGFNPFPRWLDRFHKRLQNQEPHRILHEIAMGTALAVAASFLVARKRRRTRL